MPVSLLLTDFPDLSFLTSIPGLFLATSGLPRWPAVFLLFFKSTFAKKGFLFKSIYLSFVLVLAFKLLYDQDFLSSPDLFVLAIGMLFKMFDKPGVYILFESLLRLAGFGFVAEVVKGKGLEIGVLFTTLFKSFWGKKNFLL